MSLKTYSLQARRQLMNVMDAVLACYGSHKGHTPSEKNGKMWEFCRGILTGGFFLTKLLLGFMGRT